MSCQCHPYIHDGGGGGGVVIVKNNCPCENYPEVILSDVFITVTVNILGITVNQF